MCNNTEFNQPKKYFQEPKKSFQEPETLTVICAWCRLLKNGVIPASSTTPAQLVWPEPYSPDRVFIEKDSDIWANASHGICPECADTAFRLNRGI